MSQKEGPWRNGSGAEAQIDYTRANEEVTKFNQTMAQVPVIRETPPHHQMGLLDLASIVPMTTDPHLVQEMLDTTLGDDAGHPN